MPTLRSVSVVAFLSCVALHTGCSPTAGLPSQPADSNLARQALTKALDTWKSGSDMNSIQNHRPPWVVVDEDWRQGYSLHDYRLFGDSEPYGQNLRFQVGLDVSLDGQKVHKTVRYLVATDPLVHIARDDRLE